MLSRRNVIRTSIAGAATLLTAFSGASSANATMLTGHLTASAPSPFSTTPSLSCATSADQLSGKWHCVTQVVASNIPSVLPGTVVQCDLTLQKTPSGQLLAYWAQPGWVSGQTLGTVANGMLRLSHTDRYSANWSAHAEDWARVLSPISMESTSLVTQYDRNILIGQYKTQSVLQKYQ